MKKHISEIENKRISKNYTKSELCKKADISIFYYRRFLAGKTTSLKIINKLRDALGIISISDEINMKTKRFKYKKL